MSGPVVILGLGFTTGRLARRLRERGTVVYAAVRDASRFGEFKALGVQFHALTSVGLPKGAVLIHSVPPLAEPEKSAMRALIAEIAPRRILYISSTGVYGAQTHVNEESLAAPIDDKGRARLDEEQWIASEGAPWSSLILRSAAIYGPGRGIHMRLREGKLPRGAGGIVSRIHVEDLASLLDAGIDSELEGAWPVGDDEPAASEDVAAWCAKLLDIDVLAGRNSAFSVAGRCVDGKRIRKLLNVKLSFPSYKTGIPASLRGETC